MACRAVALHVGPELRRAEALAERQGGATENARAGTNEQGARVVQRQHAIELVTWLELKQERAEAGARQHRARVRHLAGLGQPRRAGGEDVDEVAGSIDLDARERAGRCASQTLFQVAAVVDHQVVQLDVSELAHGLGHLALNQRDPHSRRAQRVGQRLPAQVMVDQRRRRAQSGDAERDRQVHRRVFAHQGHHVAGPNTEPFQHVSDARRERVQLGPGELVVAHLQGQPARERLGVLGHDSDQALVVPLSRADQPGQRVAHRGRGHAQACTDQLPPFRIAAPSNDVSDRSSQRTEFFRQFADEAGTHGGPSLAAIFSPPQPRRARRPKRRASSSKRPER